MGKITRVSSVEEAVILAQRFKEDNIYDWFRGQTHNWKVIPSMGRHSPDELEEIYEKLGRFCAWLESTPGLEEVGIDIDKAVAVAQHYGIPTNFIDFTIEPSIAGFFATDNKDLTIDQDCYLYCLNTQDLREFWDSICQVMTDYPKIEFLTLDVKDLWRLEAQHGVFLYCPIGILEELYPIDKIVFPYSHRYNIPVEKIYPIRKSNLEILIDQFLMSEVSRAGNQRWKAKAFERNWTIAHIPLEHDCLDEFFLRENINYLVSWQEDKIGIWLNSDAERWSNTYSEETWEFDIPYLENIPQMKQFRVDLKKNIKSRLKSITDSRKKLVRWKFRFDERLARFCEKEKTLQMSISRVFDGMRYLPYSNDDISEAISNCLILSLLWYNSGKERQNSRWEKVFEPLIKDGFEIDMSSSWGAGSKAVVSKKLLNSSVRDDVGNLVKADSDIINPSDVYFLLQFIKNPAQLFDFDCLKKNFISQIIPTQAIMQTEDEPVYFTPARLQILGLP